MAAFKIDPAFRHLTWDEWVERYAAARQEQGFTKSISLPNPTPMQPPLGYKPAPSLRDQIREMVLSERLRAEAEAAGAETFEESDDFEVGDFDPQSPYEEVFDPVELLRRHREWENKIRSEADRRDRVDYPDRFPAENEEVLQSPPSPATKNKKAAKAAPPPDQGGDDVSE